MESEEARGQVEQLRAQVAALEQLLEGQKRALLEQAERMEQSLRQLDERARELGRSEHALQAQARVFQSILDSMGDAVVVADAQGQLLHVNPAARQVLGIDPGDARREDWTDRNSFFQPGTNIPYAPGDLPLARAMRGEGVDLAEVLMRGPMSPQGVWLSVTARPLRDHTGTLRGGVAVYRDVTERRLALQALEGSERRYRAVTESAGDAIICADSRGVVTSWNRGAAGMFGYREEDVLGRPLTLLMPERYAQAHEEALARLRSGGPSHLGGKMVELHGLRRDGEEFPLEASLASWKTGEDIWFIGILRDVSARKQAEEREAKLNLARQIQQKFFPLEAPHVPGFDIGGASFPAEATGGDYFDYIPLQYVSFAGGRLGVAIGDVSGHGFAAALLMAQTRAYLRALAMTHAGVDRIVGLLNRALSADIGTDHFVTLLLAQLDPSGRSLVYTSAGHLPGYVLDAAGAVKAELESTGLPLGADERADFPAGPVTALEPGDLVLLLTDGLIEASAPDGSYFGTERVLDIVRLYRADRAQDVVRNLYHAVRAFSQNTPQVDDVTAVVIKVDP